MDDRTPTQLSPRHFGPLGPLTALGALGALGATALVAIALRADRPTRDSAAAAAIAQSQAAPAAAPETPEPPAPDERPSDPPDDEPADPPSERGDPDAAEASDDTPMAEVPCITDSTELTTDGKTAILCWGTRCRAVGDDHSADGPVPTPPQRYEYEESPSVSDGDGDGSVEVCTGDHCTQVGPRLAAALIAARTAGTAKATAETERTDDAEVLRTAFYASATRDHRVVTFRAPTTEQTYLPYVLQAWDVRRDRQLALRPPPSYTTGAPFVVDLEPMANRVIATWSVDSDPNSRAIVVDRDGHNRGAEFEAGELVQQTHDRFVVIGERGAVTILDDGRASAAGVHASGPAIGVRIDDHRIAALAQDQGTWRLLSIVDGHVRTSDIFPVCSETDRHGR